jgi:3-deoxy-D-manno-octulosonate 8-phosphate phosphatase (KDO 8-P phosphatase)
MISNDKLASVRLVAFDFDGVFTDNSVNVSQEGVESVRCWRSDGLGLSRLTSAGVHLLIISTETNPVVTVRAKKLKLPYKQSVEDKALAILETCKELGISPDDTMFVGNDINDIPAFNVVGMPVAVADAYPETYPHILYRTSRLGGYGAVREICDLIYNAKQAIKTF